MRPVTRISGWDPPSDASLDDGPDGPDSPDTPDGGCRWTGEHLGYAILGLVAGMLGAVLFWVIAVALGRVVPF